MVATPAPLSRITIGGVEVTFVPDGFGTSNPREWFSGGSDGAWDNSPELFDEDGRLVMSLGSLLVRSGDHLGLVDLGWGLAPGPVVPPEPGTRPANARGELPENLRRLGVEPEEIDTVLLSHLHGDHIGWVVDPATLTDDPTDAAPMFPRAEHVLSAPEWEYWTREAADGSTRVPSPAQFAVLESRCRIVEDGETVFPGVEAAATFGHTPGHLSFLISSGRERAVVLGDALHCPIEMFEPEMSFALDVDPELAKKTRAHLAASLIESGDLAAGPHFANFVFGRLLQSEGKPSWSFPESQRLPAGA